MNIHHGARVESESESEAGFFVDMASFLLSWVTAGHVIASVPTHFELLAFVSPNLD